MDSSPCAPEHRTEELPLNVDLDSVYLGVALVLAVLILRDGFFHTLGQILLISWTVPLAAAAVHLIGSHTNWEFEALMSIAAMALVYLVTMTGFGEMARLLRDEHPVNDQGTKLFRLLRVIFLSPFLYGLLVIDLVAGFLNRNQLSRPNGFVATPEGEPLSSGFQSSRVADSGPLLGH